MKLQKCAQFIDFWIIIFWLLFFFSSFLFLPTTWSVRPDEYILLNTSDVVLGNKKGKDSSEKEQIPSLWLKLNPYFVKWQIFMEIPSCGKYFYDLLYSNLNFLYLPSWKFSQIFSFVGCMKMKWRGKFFKCKWVNIIQHRSIW